MTEEEKRRSRGRPEGTRKVSAPGEPFGGKEFKLRLPPALNEWIREQGGQEWAMWLLEAMRGGPFPDDTTLTLDDDGAEEHYLEVIERMALLRDSSMAGAGINAARAKAAGAWLLAYAKEAEGWEAREK